MDVVRHVEGVALLYIDIINMTGGLKSLLKDLIITVFLGTECS
jgi:hypothetical protein